MLHSVCSWLKQAVAVYLVAGNVARITRGVGLCLAGFKACKVVMTLAMQMGVSEVGPA